MPAIPFLPLAIKRLAEVHPGSFVSVVEARETELIDRLRRRGIELAILRMSLLDLGPDLHVAALFEESLCVLASRDHPLARRKRLTWPELLKERWVLPPTNCIFFEHVLRTLGALGLELPRHTVEAYSIHIQLGLALHGGMLGFGMRPPIEFSPEKNLLVRLPFELPSPARAVAAVTLRSHEPSPLAQQFIAHIRDLAAAS
jgi:DNA-binding transcriptional LysR family regulator